MGLFKIDPTERLAIPILLRELGIFRSLRLGGRIRKRKDAGEPFAALEPPASEDERLSREQVGPAILLYQELQRFVDQREAYRITETVVVAGAVLFLGQTIGPLRRAELDAMDQAARDEFVKDRGGRFFNATVRWDQISGKEVAFTVLHCKFPPLCAAAGVPELAPVFCKGDEKFFGTVEPDVRLVRLQTIAGGAENCPFRLQWTDANDDGEEA